VTNEGKLWQFTGVLHRDDAVGTILRQCHAVGVQPEVLDVGNAPLISQSQSSSRRTSNTPPQNGQAGTVPVAAQSVATVTATQ
jgi:hypothetical protein